jgi:hypothetical protein
MKKVYLVLLVLFFASFSLAYESNLDNFGFEPIIINETNKTVCTDLNIELLEEDFAKSIDPILSVYASFLGEDGDNSYVSVKINDLPEKLLWPETFFCENDCVARVFVPSLKSGEVNAKICLRTGGKSTAKISKALIGLYDSPILSIENVSPKEIILGQRAQIKIKIKNVGSRPVDGFVQFVAEDLRSFIDITSFDIVEGDASADTTINSNEETEFIFYIKPTQVSTYNLPSSVIFFENIFGEKQQLFSSHPQLNVLAQEQIEVVLISGDLKDTNFNFSVRVKNNYAQDFNGVLTIFPIDLLEQETSLFLPGFTEKELSFSTKKLSPGIYSILAQVDNNHETYLSESTSFEVTDNDYSFEIFFAIIAMIIAVAIFLVIHYKKI